jgi:Arc/MetJ-type ribon-helix-helix transcriptional regulator
MYRSRKISVSLPEPVLDWLRELAAQNFVTAPEYIRRLVVDIFATHDQGRDVEVGVEVADQPPSGVRTTTSSKRSRSQEVETRSPSDAITGSNSAKQQDPGSPSETRFKGVYRYGKRWAAWIWDRDGKRMQRIGTYDSPEEAAHAHDLAAQTRYGEQSQANFPTERDQIVATAQPYLDKLAGSGLSDAEWTAWMKTGGVAPVAVSIIPPSDDTGREPLIVGAAKSLFRRSDPGSHDEP